MQKINFFFKFHILVWNNIWKTGTSLILNMWHFWPCYLLSLMLITKATNILRICFTENIFFIEMLYINSGKIWKKTIYFSKFRKSGGRKYDFLEVQCGSFQAFNYSSKKWFRNNLENKYNINILKLLWENWWYKIE